MRWSAVPSHGVHFGALAEELEDGGGAAYNKKSLKSSESPPTAGL